MFHKLCRITRSSNAYRTESVSAMIHELFAAMSSTVFDRKWPVQTATTLIIILYRRYIYAVLRNHFFGNNSGKLEPIGTKFHRHAFLQTFGYLRQADTKWRQITTFSDFLSPKQHIVSPISIGRFPWNLNTKRESVSSWMFSGQNCYIFPIRNHLPPKPHFRFFGVHFRSARSCLGL